METDERVVLCKYEGLLVLFAVVRLPEGDYGKCPECGSTQFHNGTGWSRGWTECANPDCGFAVLTCHLEDKI